LVIHCIASQPKFDKITLKTFQLKITTKKYSSLYLIVKLILKYPKRSFVILICLLFAGLAEGLGMATLLPVLSIALNGGASDNNTLTKLISYFLSIFGFEASVGILLSLITAVMIIKAALVLLAAKQVGYTAAQVATDLRLELINSLMRARWEFFTSQPTGRFVNAIATEAERASISYVTACRILAGLIQVAVFTCIAFIMSWEGTIAALVTGAVMVIILNGLVILSRRAGIMKTDLFKSLAIRLTEILSSMKTLKSMSCEERIEPLLESEILNLNKAQQKQVFSKEGLRNFQEPIVVIAIAVGLYIALTWWKLDMASLMVLVLLFGRTIQRIGMLQSYYQKVALSESAYWSIIQSIEKANSAREISRGTKKPELLQNIKFDNVSYAYSDKAVLNSASFIIPANRFTALIGPSGAGKTTIADLIIGLFQPQEGDILIDGLSIVDVNMKKWRGMIGYVPQETTLFHESIFVNITLGDPSLTLQNVENALRKAGLLEFVNSLKKGVQTIVGEKGSKLSGGQRQRISIARALVRNPRLLILDEATTALDPQTEMEICTMLQQLKEQVTVFAISHQTTLMQNADIIYYLKDGIIMKYPNVVNQMQVSQNNL